MAAALTEQAMLVELAGVQTPPTVCLASADKAINRPSMRETCRLLEVISGGISEQLRKDFFSGESAT